MKPSATLNRAASDLGLRDGDNCPSCYTGILEHRQHRFSTDRGPNLPDADWLECCDCDYATAPE